MKVIENPVRGTVERGYRLRTERDTGSALWLELGSFPSMSCVGQLGKEIPRAAERLGSETILLTCRGIATPQARYLAGEVCRRWKGERYVSPKLEAGGIPLIVPAVSGGTLEAYLLSQKGEYALWLEAVHMDFRLPEKTGVGKPISLEEAQSLRTKYGSGLFYSRELCTRYFSYRAPDGTHFVLTDDEKTIWEKAKTGEKCGAKAGIWAAPGESADTCCPHGGKWREAPKGGCAQEDSPSASLRSAASPMGAPSGCASQAGSTPCRSF